MPSQDFYVYVILDPRVAGNFRYGRWSFKHEPIYVGMGSGLRHRATLIAAKANPYKRSKLLSIARAGAEPEVLIKRSGLFMDEAYELEIKLISAIGRKQDGGPLTNLTAGGDGVRSPSESTRAKMSAAAKARGISDAQRAKIVESLRGRTFSDEQRARMSAGRTGIKTGPLSEAHRQALSSALLGKTKTPRTKTHTQNLSAALTRRYVTYKNKSRPLMEWSKILDMPYNTLNMRLYKYNWPVSRAFETPVLHRNSL